MLTKSNLTSHTAINGKPFDIMINNSNNGISFSLYKWLHLDSIYNFDYEANATFLKICTITYQIVYINNLLWFLPIKLTVLQKPGPIIFEYIDLICQCAFAINDNNNLDIFQYNTISFNLNIMI